MVVLKGSQKDNHHFRRGGGGLPKKRTHPQVNNDSLPKGPNRKSQRARRCRDSGRGAPNSSCAAPAETFSHSLKREEGKGRKAVAPCCPLGAQKEFLEPLLDMDQTRENQKLKRSICFGQERSTIVWPFVKNSENDHFPSRSRRNWCSVPGKEETINTPSGLRSFPT